MCDPNYGDPYELVSLVPVAALGGRDCDDACEICPLRAWKSPGITTVYCRDVLEEYRVWLEAVRKGAGHRGLLEAWSTRTAPLQVACGGR